MLKAIQHTRYKIDIIWKRYFKINILFSKRENEIMTSVLNIMRIVRDCKKSIHNLASYSLLPYFWKRNDLIIFICAEKSGKIEQSFPKVRENEEKWGGTSKVRTNEELGGTVGTLQISRFYLNVTSKFYFLHFISPPPPFPHLLESWFDRFVM